MKKLISYILVLSTTIMLCMTLTTSLAYADGDPDEKFVPPIIPKAENLPGPEKSDVEKDGSRKILSQRVLPRFAVGTIGFVGGLSLLFLVIGGVRFATAYGKEESVENAKKQVIYALIGLVIALLSFTIVSIISSVDLDSDTSKGPATQSADGILPAGQELPDDVQDAMDKANESFDE